MLLFYSITIALLFYATLPFTLVYVLVTGRHLEGLAERFGMYQNVPERQPDRLRIWIHAASVGEVQAARAIVSAISGRIAAAEIIITTMTTAGRSVAREQLGPDVTCHLSPLDVPGIVGRAIRRLNPDVYINIETELWPVLLSALAKRNTYLALVNGRLSEKSYGNYFRMKRFFGPVLTCFSRIAVISDGDRDKFLSLGGEQRCISVEGNVKYVLTQDEKKEEIASKLRQRMSVVDEEVFIAGSTHDDEEKQLLKLYLQQKENHKVLWLMAPRHVVRIDSLRSLLEKHHIRYQLFSQIKAGEEERDESLILVDTMGDLARLYACADFIFCGGSLVAKGGHNLMEAAICDKIVFYGPHIDDFRDAAQLLETVGGGSVVRNSEELGIKMDEFRDNREAYIQSCRAAGTIARAQQGNGERQVAFVLQPFLIKS